MYSSDGSIRLSVFAKRILEPRRQPLRPAIGPACQERIREEQRDRYENGGPAGACPEVGSHRKGRQEDHDDRNLNTEVESCSKYAVGHYG